MVKGDCEKKLVPCFLLFRSAAVFPCLILLSWFLVRLMLKKEVKKEAKWNKIPCFVVFHHQSSDLVLLQATAIAVCHLLTRIRTYVHIFVWFYLYMQYTVKRYISISYRLVNTFIPFLQQGEVTIYIRNTLNSHLRHAYDKHVKMV